MASDPKQQERFTITSIYAKMDVAAINQKFYSNYWVITTVKVMIWQFSNQHRLTANHSWPIIDIPAPLGYANISSEQQQQQQRDRVITGNKTRGI